MSLILVIGTIAAVPASAGGRADSAVGEASTIVATRPHTQVVPLADRTPGVKRSTAFIARHTNRLLAKKCLPLFRDHAPRSKWIARHRAAHKRARAQCPAPIPHRSGWLCIHSREGAWNSNTGNGYYGGLQMHLDWYGVHRADLLSPEQQMAAAERAYRQSGYSHSWLAGQWPNTYPPCAGLF